MLGSVPALLRLFGVFGVGIAVASANACGSAAAAAPPPDGEPFRTAAAAAHQRAEVLATRGGPFTAEDARGLLDLALIDVGRFAVDDAFRARVLESLPEALPEGAPEPLRDRVLYELQTGPGLSFEQSEALERAWGAALRDTTGREVSLPASGLVYPDEIDDPIAASFFSFPAGVVELGSAARLLRAVRATAPGRELVVLADLPLRERLAATTADLGVHWVESYGRPYSPWPRDPFSAARLPDGGLVLVERPGRQAGREGDLWMARELVQNLPAELDAAWGGSSGAGAAWGRAPFFFHNGHLLTVGGAVWTSLPGLERPVLEVLGLDRVPVESFFAGDAGVDRYMAATRQVIAEMSAFYGRPVRLVHPLPEGPGGHEAAQRRAALLRTLGGGTGVDLDSLVTFVPAADGGDGIQVLVGDLEAGRDLLLVLEEDDLAGLRRTYDLTPPAVDLRSLLADAQRSRRAAALAAFLDLVADHLAASGLPVRRLPLLQVPTALLADHDRYAHDDFLIGWNNVVLERGAAATTAEGFASGIAAGDEAAAAIYRQVGVDLVLLPPLVESVKANGGYRCASNQVRRAAGTRAVR